MSDKKEIGEESKEKKKQQKRASSLYPKMTLMDSLKLAESIRKNNNSKPYNRLDLAKTVGRKPASSEFKKMISYSYSYGLTLGNEKSENISLSPLGESIVSPKPQEEKNASLKTAMLKIPLFEKFYTHFNQGMLPKKDFLLNTLQREYNIPSSDCEDCYNVLVRNAKELGILDNQGTSQYIRLDKLSPQELEEGPELPFDSNVEIQESEDGQSRVDPMESKENFPILPVMGVITKPKVFISHSNNIKILSQIKQILSYGQFDYVIAEERETTAIPIAEKVFGLMKECNSAIINLSVDEQKEDDGCHSLNANVLIEIGAAFLQYNKKVILLVDKRLVDMIPSNLQGLYRSEYQGDELSLDSFFKLQDALIGFRDSK